MVAKINLISPLSTNQYNYLSRVPNSWLNVAEGGKRGGKNILNALAFAMTLEEHPNRLHLIGAVSIANAKMNIIDCDGFGLLNYFEGRCREGKYKNKDCLYIKTKTSEKIVLIAGGLKDGDEKYIKGNSYGTAYVTEANECHVKFVKEVFDRTIASKDRKIFHDFNPKAEAHYYYVDILDFHEKRQKNNPNYGLNYGHFTIADNMSLTQEKINREMATYDKKSIWFQRDILGLRKQVEGLVYDMFDDGNLYDDTERPENLEHRTQRTIALDYGTTNPTVFLDIYDDDEFIWVDNEYRFDYNEAEGKKKKSDVQYADDMVIFMGKEYQCEIIADPSAESFITELKNRLFFVTGADNDVLNGIRRLSTLFYKKIIKIHKYRCAGLVKELQAYVWDEKAAKYGEEKPVKQGDHGADALRYFVNTKIPKWRIGV